MYTNFGIISATICHNPPGEGSRKLYYYSNSSLFQCYTGGCEKSNFDIFELTIKIFSIQYKKEIDLNTAIRWIAQKFGFSASIVDDVEDRLEDWDILNNYDRIQEIDIGNNNIIQLKEYDKTILNNFNYNVKITPWLQEDISQETMTKAVIGYYPGGDQITIPHFDKDNRFIGLRGRTVCADEGERYGKYRPIRVNNQLYNHPLGLNLYGINWAKDTIKSMKKAIVYESEKSVLKQMSYFGIDNNISVACCGSSLSSYQVQLLLEMGAEEIIIAFDKQYEALNTIESKQWIKKLTSFHEKYKNNAVISFMFDKGNVLSYKSSPIDEGKDKFLFLFKERIIL